MRNAATSAAAPMAIETAASVVCLDLVRRDVFSSEKTIAQPTVTVATTPLERSPPRIGRRESSTDEAGGLTQVGIGVSGGSPIGAARSER
jgi:hypothetical protein